MQNGFFTANHQRVAGVMPALKPHNRISLLGQQINNFAFALVAPLGSKYHHVSAHAPDSISATHSPSRNTNRSAWGSDTPGATSTMTVLPA